MQTKPKRVDPLLVFRYSIFIEGMQTMGFSKCEGLGQQTEVLEKIPQCYFTPKIQFGVTRFEPIVLSKGLSKLSILLYLWGEQVFHVIRNPGINRVTIRRNLTINVKDKAGKNVLTYKIYNCAPSSIMGPNLDAMSDDVAITSMTLQNEGQELIYFKRVDEPEFNINIPIVSNRILNLNLPKLRGGR